MKKIGLANIIKKLREYGLTIAIKESKVLWFCNRTTKRSFKTDKEKIAYLKGVLDGINDYSSVDAGM